MVFQTVAFNGSSTPTPEAEAPITSYALSDNALISNEADGGEAVLFQGDHPLQDLKTTESSAYFLEGQAVMQYDFLSGQTTALFHNETLNYYVPLFENGIMWGTAAPTNEQSYSYNGTAYVLGLDWPGTYYYYDGATGENERIDDPGAYLHAFSSNIVFSTTINGTAIPIDANGYRIGEIHHEVYTVPESFTCQNFALDVSNRIYGSFTFGYAATYNGHVEKYNYMG